MLFVRLPLFQLWTTQKRPAEIPLQALPQDLHRSARQTPWGDDYTDGTALLWLFSFYWKETAFGARSALPGLIENTIMKLLVVAGEKCEKIMGRYIRNVTVQRR